MPADSISTGRAKPDKLFYFVANVVVVKDGECLILQRSDEEKVHPGRWCVPGGKLEWKDLPLDNPTRVNGDVLDFQDAVEDLLARETREEAGIEIDTDDMRYLNSVAFVRPDGIPVVLVKFAARYSSGTVRYEKGAFQGAAWVDAKTVKDYPCIDGIPEEIENALDLFF